MTVTIAGTSLGRRDYGERGALDVLRACRPLSVGSPRGRTAFSTLASGGSGAVVVTQAVGP